MGRSGRVAEPEPAHERGAAGRGGRLPPGGPAAGVQLHDGGAQERADVQRGGGGHVVAQVHVDHAVPFAAVAEDDRELRQRGTGDPERLGDRVELTGTPASLPFTRSAADASSSTTATRVVSSRLPNASTAPRRSVRAAMPAEPT